MEWSRKARVTFVFAVSLSSIAVASGETVTEADAIRLFLETCPRARSISPIEQSAGAELRMNAQVANPEVTYQIEDAAGVRDEFLTLQQKLPLTGRRGLMGESAKAALRAAGLAAKQVLRTDTFKLKSSFYEVLYRERAVELLQQGTKQLERVVEILGRREEEGEGSGYDLLRAEQELAQIRIETAEAGATLSTVRSRFGSFFDPGLRMESVGLEGNLETSGPVPEPESAVELALHRRVDLRALGAEEERSELERRAALRRRVPEPTLTAGWKRTEAPGLDDRGFVAALSVPLPIFDRGQIGIARATADRRLAGLEAEILRREIRAEVLAALARERASRESAERYGSNVERRAAELRTIARLRYDEGESGILELLDAHRTALAAELRALEVEYEAKRAEIERDRVIGSEVKP